MKLRVIWQQEAVTVVELTESDLHTAASNGVDVTDPHAVGMWAHNELDDYESDWLWEIAQRSDEQDRPELIDVTCYEDGAAS